MVLLSVAACDVIDPNEYITPVVGGDTTIAVTNKRVVLIEEFTGQRCPNCPKAAEEVHKLQKIYPDQVLVIAIHSGFFAMPIGEFTADYRTEEGTEIYNYFHPETFPNSTFCRMKIDESYLVGYQSWESLVPTVVEQDAIANVTIDPIKVNNETREIEITVKTEMNTANSMNVKVAAFILENGIVSPQAYDQTVQEEYVHNHVLRGGFAGAWGEDIKGLGSDSKTFKLTADTEWNLNNCEVVAYIYNKETMEILQAVKAEL